MAEQFPYRMGYDMVDDLKVYFMIPEKQDAPFVYLFSTSNEYTKQAKSIDKRVMRLTTQDAGESYDLFVQDESIPPYEIKIFTKGNVWVLPQKSAVGGMVTMRTAVDCPLKSEPSKRLETKLDAAIDEIKNLRDKFDLLIGRLDKAE